VNRNTLTEQVVLIYHYNIHLWAWNFLIVYLCMPRRRRMNIDLALSVRLFVRPPECPSVTNLFGLYLKEYYRFEHEASGDYRSHWGEVHCTWTITLHCLILELLPFVIFLSWTLCKTYLSDSKYISMTLYR